MLKKVDSKLINICLVCLIIYLIYHSSGLWIGLLFWIKKVIYPIFISFFLAYAFYPIVNFFIKKKIPKALGLFIVIAILILVILLFVFLFIPLIFNNIGEVINQVITFLEYISHKYQFNINNLENALVSNFNMILNNIGAFSGIINKIFGYISVVIIIFSFFIYFLNYMDDVRNIIKKKIPNNIYDLVIKIDLELKKYFSSFIKIMFITFFEYSLSLLIIGHPNFLILGLLASLASFIPCFGGIIINVISAITAFVISKTLFIKTLILIIILSFIDTYVINPYIYGKSNKIHPVITLLSFFIFEKIFGIMGIIISMPITIIMLTIYRYFKEEKYDTKT